MNPSSELIVQQGSAGAGWVKSIGQFNVVKASSTEAAQGRHPIFVVVAASQLSRVAALVKRASKRGDLRALFVHRDITESSLGAVLARAKVGASRTVVVHTDDAVPRRIVSAWASGAQNALIANAEALDDCLFVQSCALQVIEVPWGAIPILAEMSEAQRKAFNIDADGSCLHWPDGDVHLDLNAFRVATDPKAQEAAEASRLRSMEYFGLAVAAVRKAHGLPQTAITGVSERQIRRIERGKVFPRMSTLATIAAAHGLSRPAYLDEVARAHHSPHVQSAAHSTQ